MTFKIKENNINGENKTINDLTSTEDLRNHKFTSWKVDNQPELFYDYCIIVRKIYTKKDVYLIAKN